MKRFLSLLLLLGAWSTQLWATVGYREWEVEGTTLSVWYPSGATETRRSIGPFELNYAFDGAPRAGQWPLIVFSHGNGGHVHNHYLTLQALAEAGFVVVAPQHGKAAVAKTLNVGPAIQQRVRDLDRAVSAVQADGALGAVVDRRWVHALGYGLGGTSVLVAAGAQVDESLIRKHCQDHAQEDLDLCSNDPVSDLKQKLTSLFSAFSRANSISTQEHFAPVHGRVAVVAPMGQGLQVKSGSFMVNRLLDIAVEGDVIRPPRFHAQVIQQTAPQLTTLQTMAGHHYAFLAPLPSWMLKKNEYFTVNDPPGFDRPAFLQQINATLLRFFTAP